jgi:hypothetical protein
MTLLQEPPEDAAPTRQDALRSLGRRVLDLADRVRGSVGDAGMATAEYAIATLAAVGFAGLLVVILKGGEVRALLSGIIRRALTL